MCNLDKYIFNFGKIHFTIGQIHFAIWTNTFYNRTHTFCNLEKYIFAHVYPMDSIHGHLGKKQPASELVLSNDILGQYTIRLDLLMTRFEIPEIVELSGNH